LETACSESILTEHPACMSEKKRGGRRESLHLEQNVTKPTKEVIDFFENS
jgi:hypothetical protein